MIITDMLFSLNTNIIMFTYLSNMLMKKKIFILYLTYGLEIDIIFLNEYPLSTIILIILYFYRKKRKRINIIEYIIIFNLIIITNLLLNHNFSYLYSFEYFISLILNISYFYICNKKHN